MVGSAANETEDLDHCDVVKSVLSRVGDKWSMLAMWELRHGPQRFNELRRRLPPISQRVLTSTLRALEYDGLVTRTVLHTTPPRVEYGLTHAGRDLQILVNGIAEWADTHIDDIRAARSAHESPTS